MLASAQPRTLGHYWLFQAIYLLTYAILAKASGGLPTATFSEVGRRVCPRLRQLPRCLPSLLRLDFLAGARIRARTARAGPAWGERQTHCARTTAPALASDGGAGAKGL